MVQSPESAPPIDLAFEFDLRPDILYLNHAAVSPWPRRTAEAVKAFAEENVRQGSWEYPRWLATESRLRARLARLINAPCADDIALVKNTSEALSFVAAGLPWRAGDNVVTSAEEFPSNRIVWESLRSQGVELREVPLDQGSSPEEALLARVDARTRLLSISSVQYASGLRMDVAALGRGCRQQKVLFCIDAIQSVGALQLDVQAVGADFVAADGHKWMLGPEGLGLFYCREPLREQLRLTQFGWHMVEQAGEFDRREWQPAHSGRRFEAGSPNMLAIHALDASLSLLEQYGMAQVEADVLAKTGYLAEAITKSPHLELLSPTAPRRRSGIITFRPREEPLAGLYARLQQAGVVCAQRGGGVRFSPHFYTPDEVLDRALALLQPWG